MTAAPPRSSRAERTARHLGIYGAGQIAQAALAFFLVAVLARSLGREGFGRYSLVFVVASLGALIADFGLGPWLTRAAAQEPGHARRRLIEVLRLRAVLTVISWALTLAGGALYLRGTSLLGAVTTMLAYLTVSGTVVVLESLLIGRGYVGRVTISIVGGKALELLAVLAWLASGRPVRLTEVIGVLFAACLVRLLVVARLCAPALRPPEAAAPEAAAPLVMPAATGAPEAVAPPPHAVGPLLAQVLPFALGAWVWMAYFRVDVLLLQRLATPAALGLYAAAYRVIEALLLVPRTVVGVTYPAASAAWRDGTLTRRLLARPGQLLALASLAAAGGLWALAPATMTFLFGAPFADGAAALRVLALAIPVLFLNQYLGMLLPATHRQNVWVALLGLALVVNVIANLLLIPRYGIAGAAGATLISEGFACAGYAWLVVRRHGWFLPPWWLLRAALAAGAMAWLVGFVPGPFLLRVAAGALIFAALTALLRVIGAEELALGARLLRAPRASAP